MDREIRMKEQALLEKLLSFQFVISESLVDLSKGNYDEATFIKKVYDYLHKYYCYRDAYELLTPALDRLAAYDKVSDRTKILTYYRSDIGEYDYAELAGGISRAVCNKLGEYESIYMEAHKNNENIEN